MKKELDLSFKYTDELVNYLLEIEKYRSALNYLSLPTRSKQKIQYEAKIKQTHFSTSIEGNVLNIEQVKNVVNNKAKQTRIQAEQEVLNYWNALSFLEISKKDKTKITKDFIFNLHNIIEAKSSKITKIDFRKPTPPGFLFAVYDSITKNPEYIPPEAKDVEGLIDELVLWIEDNANLPSAVRAAIIHYAFVTIHPFEDGNGRSARALATYSLMIDDYDFKGFNSFEEYYSNNLNEYYQSLQMNLDPLFYNGRNKPPHLEQWITYFCKIMALNAQNVYLCALEASEKNKTFNELLNDLNKKDLTLLRYCIENNKSIIHTKDLANIFGVTSRAILKWTKDWVNKGILVPNSGKERITSYKLSDKYGKLKINDLGFID
ncbi:Fic family protein [Mycoplasmopsis adleri]|uniref:Fic family protein n=1 Tax=Mycoplasmopsis adleri TaxID=51362 RepID=UPI003873AA46